MDKHLNLFKFFNETPSVEHIENNLSRAFVLCLQNDNLFLYKFLERVVRAGNHPSDLEYLFANPDRESRIDIDIQKSTRDLDQSGFKRIYAVALTENETNLSDFFELHAPKDENYKPITDILITVGDVIFIVEVKRNGQNCKQQLFEQVFYAASKNVTLDIVVPINYDWPKVMETATLSNNFNLLCERKSIFTNDFISLIRRYRTRWLPVTSFSALSENRADDDLRNIRLESCVMATGERLDLLNKTDRFGFSFQKAWADEILPRWIRTKEDKLYLKIYIWPANTKGQGWSVFYNKNWDWLNLKEVNLLGENFKVDIVHEIKFSHIQGNYITSINFTNDDLIKEINTTENFERYAGQHKRENWSNFENFLDAHFKPEFDWRQYCRYDQILNSGKSFYSISLGYQVGIKVPFSYLQSIDKDARDTSKVQDLFVASNDFYLTLLDSKPAPPAISEEVLV